MALSEYLMKSKIGKMFAHKNYKQKMKQIKFGRNGHEYIPFRIDGYFFGYNLAVEVDEKGQTDRNLIFEKKRQEALEKKLIVILVELIPIKKIMMYFMKLVEYKHLSVSLRIKNLTNSKKK